MPSTNYLPQPGDLIYYNGRSINGAPPQVCHGIFAERAPSPLTGRPRIRVVDSWREAADPEAGRWLDATDLIGHYA